MAPDDDPDSSWRRQLVIGLSALVAVALVIGGVVSIVALVAAKVSGIRDAQPEATSKPSLVMPTGTPSTSLEPYPAPSRSGSAKASPSPGATSSSSPGDAPQKKKPITLQASPLQAAPGARVTLSGIYRHGEGHRLQVQRFDHGWTVFPVSVSVVGSQFTTYITTSRTGVNRFRVVDQAGGGKASNAVRVTIG